MKKKSIVRFLIVSIAATLALSSTVSAKNLSYWSSNCYDIGYMNKSPSLYYKKMDSSSSFPFLTAIQQGRSQWNSALSTSISNPSATNTSAIMQFYGGTKQQIKSLGCFVYVDDGGAGATIYTSENESAIHYYGNQRIIEHKIWGSKSAVLSDVGLSYNNCIKTTMHEMGHALGWYGHASNSSFVMYQGRSSVTTLKSGEKNHLSQIYR